jgi:hypothetical protein
MACVNNLKQLGIAIQMYWDDNSGQLNGLYDTFPTGATQAGRTPGRIRFTPT